MVCRLFTRQDYATRSPGCYRSQCVLPRFYPSYNSAVTQTTHTESALPSETAITDWAKALGFDAVGFSSIDLSDQEAPVRDFLRAGFQGSMGYLERNLEKRLNPDALEPGTVCVITARMNYWPEDTQPLTILHSPEKAYISRYALGRDYHKVLRKRLARLARQIDNALPGYRYRAFTDSAPVLEKALAAQGGLGWMGTHTLILNRDVGSWFFLGEIFTNAPFPTTSREVADECGKCNACMSVCPTDAIVAPHVLDARRCISYLTIEHRGAIPHAYRELMGNRIFGCDDCQLHCPWNRDVDASSLSDFRPRHGLDDRELLSLWALDEADFLALTEGSAMRRISFEQWQRNLAIALGNGPSGADVITALRQKRDTTTPMVQEHIDWALAKLSR